MSDFKIIYQFKDGCYAIKPSKIADDIKRMEELIEYNDVRSVNIPSYMNVMIIDSDGRAVHL